MNGYRKSCQFDGLVMFRCALGEERNRRGQCRSTPRDIGRGATARVCDWSISGLTYRPLRGRAMRYPCSMSDCTASDTVLRDTPSMDASDRVGGTGVFGGTMPERMAWMSVSRTRTCLVLPRASRLVNNLAQTMPISRAWRMTI